MALLPAAYEPDAFPAAAAPLAAVATTRLTFHFRPDTTLWHMLLDDGAIYDLHVQSVETDPPEEIRLVLACREPAFGEKLAQAAEPSERAFPPADGEEIARVLQMFWMNQQKGLKVHHRGLLLLAWQGQGLMGLDLVRLCYVAATGLDCGPLNRMTIHSLTGVVRAVQAARADVLAVVGQPGGSAGELMAAAQRLQDATADVGRALAARLGFAYPAAAEDTVRRSWARYLGKVDS